MQNLIIRMASKKKLQFEKVFLNLALYQKGRRFLPDLT